VLVSIVSLRKAYCRLMDENAEGTPLAEIDGPASTDTPNGGKPAAK